ncbi:hypothetical protein [Amycolatopsis echigonensis]|uniref:Uncharacterized protein n=1 Tax=Amycolatopsis echigonensis TaxID=2576905 RepID=A0A2N3WPP2_9PSEU|nr:MULTISPECIES: hypothetical protein [Amycolatopsis]MBB2505869.1 hypothetical protein [Amycolatopsis echigonensis]PKV95841.1 hypothetical protein ATK30_6773 [Amycolatopsis niigatensis]
MGEQPSTRAATAALVLSIVSWLAFIGTYPSHSSSFGDALYYQPVTVLGPLVLPLLAIVFGHLGRRAGGRGRSSAALVLGYLALALEVARLMGMATAH